MEGWTRNAGMMEMSDHQIVLNNGENGKSTFHLVFILLAITFKSRSEVCVCEVGHYRIICICICNRIG